MPLIATANESGNYTPAPEGVHQAVCVDVIDKGMVESKGFDGKPPRKKHMVSVAWQIDELRDDGKRYVVYRRYTLSLNEKATLRKDLESWRGRKFTREEEMGFDVETVIGANCLVNIQHHTAGDKTYANVVSVMPLVKGMAKIAALGYVREAESQQQAEEPTSDTNGYGVEEHEPQGEPITDKDIPF